MTKPYNCRKLVSRVSVILGIFFAFLLGNITGYNTRAALAANEPTQFAIFWETWDLVDEYFVDREKVDFTQMTYGAIRGMLESLGDKNHTVFFTPEEARQQAESMEGEFEGIGAFVALEEGKFTITQPMRGSPAEKAGLLPGDIILAVNGESIEGLAESTVISKIRGPAGTSVMLEIIHAGSETALEITVTRARIEIDSVLWSKIPGTDFVYVQLSQFASDTANELEVALTESLKTNENVNAVRGIVLDLRNNPGGYLNEAIRVGSEFLEPGKIILNERDAEGKTTALKAFGTGLARNIPIIVLVNKASASAAEIVSGALQVHGRGKLVGETTAGTGTVLNSFTLSDGSVVRIGVTNWLTPDERLLKDRGVEPDVKVALPTSVRLLDAYTLKEMKPEDVNKYGDVQFNSALLLLKLQALNISK